VSGIPNATNPGAQGVIYDTALRGAHHQHLLRELGLLPINRLTAAQATLTKARRKERRVEKNVLKGVISRVMRRGVGIRSRDHREVVGG
jgi:hypothetical protein